MIHLLPVHVQYISMQKGERRCWTLAIHTRGGETGKESGVGKGGEMHYSMKDQLWARIWEKREGTTPPPQQQMSKSKSPGEGNGSPLQYSCLENPMDIRAWWATVHRIAKSQTWLSD